jgi:hypothetical protein
MGNSHLSNAKNTKNDEFYTMYDDIEKEISEYLKYNPDVFRGKTILLPCDDPELSNFTKFFVHNFDIFGIKKLISTCQTKNSKNGRIFTLSHDKSGDGKTDANSLEWKYLTGNGDFKSHEIIKLRDEADIIVTNPPFSLLREFLTWTVQAEKRFLVIGNINAITYKAVFPLIQKNKIWLGATNLNTSMYFKVPDDFVHVASYKFEQEQNGEKVMKMSSILWFTNLEHGKQYRSLPLMSMKYNLNFSRHKKIKGRDSYEHYENYSAIEVPYTDAIPGDYTGMMGVPVTFLGKYNPEQFEICGMCENENLYGLKTKIYTTQECKQAYFAKFGRPGTYDLNASGVVIRDGLREKVYQRILIRRKTLIDS